MKSKLLILFCISNLMFGMMAASPLSCDKNKIGCVFLTAAIGSLVGFGYTYQDPVYASFFIFSFVVFGLITECCFGGKRQDSYGMIVS